MNKNYYTQAEYYEYLQSSQWQAKRKAKAEQKKYTCEKCHKKILKGFHIHHKTYKHFKNEPLKDLMFLCEDCHKKIHKTRKKGKSNKKNGIKNYLCKNCQSVLYRIERKTFFLFKTKYIVVCNKCGKRINYIKIKQ